MSETTPYQQLRTTTAGSEPVALEAGRFAVDIAAGILYVGDASDLPLLLSQRIDLSNEASPPAVPKEGRFWFQLDTGKLMIYDGTEYKSIAAEITEYNPSIVNLASQLIATQDVIAQMLLE